MLEKHTRSDVLYFPTAGIPQSKYGCIPSPSKSNPFTFAGILKIPVQVQVLGFHKLAVKFHSRRVLWFYCLKLVSCSQDIKLEEKGNCAGTPCTPTLLLRLTGSPLQVPCSRCFRLVVALGQGVLTTIPGECDRVTRHRALPGRGRRRHAPKKLFLIYILTT